MNTSELLAQFARDRSETVFCELMPRFVNLAFSVAQRRLPEPTQVEEVVQDVFIRLARLDPFPASEGDLVGWLHTTTHRIAIDRWRKDSRRLERETKALEMTPPGTPSDPPWNEVAPVLDDALAALEPADRDAILLRYFKDEPFKAIARAIGVTDGAAKMRVSRALDKLRQQLLQKGITGSALALAASLETHALSTAPVALTARVVSKVRISAFRAGNLVQLKSPVIGIGKAILAGLLVGVAFLLWLNRPYPSRFRQPVGDQLTAAARLATPSPRAKALLDQIKRADGTSPAPDLLARLRSVREYANRHKEDRNQYETAESAIRSIESALNDLAKEEMTDREKVPAMPVESPAGISSTPAYFEKLAAELQDPEKRRTFVPEERWMAPYPYWTMDAFLQARDEVASQADPEIAELLRRVPIKLNQIEDQTVDLEAKADPGEFIGRALGVAERPENGISPESLARVKNLLARDQSLLNRVATTLTGTSRADKLNEVARAIGAIDPKLYLATVKSFLDYNPEMDRLLLGTAPVEPKGNQGKP